MEYDWRKEDKKEKAQDNDYDAQELSRKQFFFVKDITTLSISYSILMNVMNLNPFQF